MEPISIQAIVDYVNTCPFIADFSALLTGFTGDAAGECGIFDDGEQQLKGDMLGNVQKRRKYALVARNPTTQDLDRIRATDFCSRFQLWIDEQEMLGNYPRLPSDCQAYSIKASDARITARAQDGKTALYEIPINLTYWRWLSNA